jgi:hypothetical protein
VSVAACHYFQGTQGTMFWNLLREYRILMRTAGYEDDSLLDHGFGITDIAKAPRPYGQEPSAAEYIAGMDRILTLIDRHDPDVVVFVYKKVLDEVLRRRFGTQEVGLWVQQQLATQVRLARLRVSDARNTLHARAGRNRDAETCSRRRYSMTVWRRCPTRSWLNVRFREILTPVCCDRSWPKAGHPLRQDAPPRILTQIHLGASGD